VEKGQGTVAVACRKQGYLEAAGNLASEFQAMTFGNILFGGIIGVVVDAAIEQRRASARVAGRD